MSNNSFKFVIFGSRINRPLMGNQTDPFLQSSLPLSHALLKWVVAELLNTLNFAVITRYVLTAVVETL